MWVFFKMEIIIDKYFLLFSFSLWFMYYRKSRFQPLARTKKEAKYYLGLNGKDFTRDEREAVYNRANGRCEICGMKTVLRKKDERRNLFGQKIRVANAHHCGPDSLGFDASVDHGMNLCAPCNIKLSNKCTWYTVRTQKKLWRQGKPYKIWLSREDKKRLWFPRVKGVR